MTIVLRDYQIECLEAVLAEYKAGTNRQLLALPTGSGKTVIMAAIAKQMNKKTLLLAHREELITQAIEKFKLFWPEVDIGVCKGEMNDVANQVIVASVQSASRPNRLEKLKEQNFEVMMVDECHHSPATTYQTVIDALGFRQNNAKLLIGVSATPQRLGLGETFQKIVFSRSIGTMIKAGYLSPVIGRKILTSFILEKVRTQNGDFAIGELAEACNTTERNAFIVSKFKTYADGRKGIAFCCDVQHCQDLADAFNKEGIAASAVWGDMATEERKQALNDLKTGRIQIATSCGVLTEGFDEPTIDSVIMARPTKSPSLYIQCVGRGLRTWPGKQNCLVLDFTDRSNNLDSVMSLSKTIPEAEHVTEGGHQAEQEKIDKKPKLRVSEDVDKEFDILGNARFIWIPLGDDEWSLIDDDRQEIIMKPFAHGYIATLHAPNGSSKDIVSSPLPLDYCSGVAEDFARRHLKITFADMNAPWMKASAQPTPGQREYLMKMKSFREGMTKTEAALEIRKIISLKNKQRRALQSEGVTPKQFYALQAAGIDPKNMTKFQAMQAISRIKQAKQSHL